jgi:hypothetical protein
MATDPTLKNLFGSMDDATPAVDVDSVLRRTRRRRLPKRAAAGGVLTLAIGGIAVAGFQGLGGLSQSSGGSSDSAASTSEDSGDTSQLYSAESDGETETGATTDSSDASDIKRAPADRINLCGGPLADVAPSATGLVLTTQFDDAAVGASSVDGIVTMTNEGTETVSGTTAASAAITLSQDGVVLWHSNGPMIEMAAVVDLAPGESMEYAASFVPVVCAVEDDLTESFRDDLPAAPAGSYEVSALIDLSTDGNAELITGPPSTITLE